MPALTKPEKLTQTDSHCSLEGVGVLTELGLSERQARVYLALLKAGSGGARIVAGLAGVPRQESYGLLTQLQRLGLARQNLTVPASYTATPFIEAARLLLERKTQELTAITLRANQITSNLNQNQPTQPITAPTTPKTSFGEIIEGEDGKHYQTAIEQTQVSVWVISSWTRFRHSRP